jgi:hypothetical protein
MKSISGWPDVVLPTHTTKEGLKREQQSIGDGFTSIFNSFDLDVTFANVIEDPVIHLFTVWTNYIAEVFEGNVNPYLDFITENEIDYNTRIYKFVLDEDGKRIRRVGITGASFPISVPMGKFFDESDGSILKTQNLDVNVRFKCDGAMYNDQIIFHWFNKTAVMFNKKLQDVLDNKKDSGFIKVPDTLRVAISNRAYPLVDVNTNELTWWIEKEYLKEVEESDNV